MNRLFLVLGLVLVATPSFAITRTVECTRTANSDRFLTVLLRGGNATLFECNSGPCPAETDPVELGQISGSSNEEDSVTYRVLQGNYPARQSFKVKFPADLDGPVELSIDGRLGDYNCR